MELYYNVVKKDGNPDPVLLLEEKSWYDLNQDLRGPMRGYIDNAVADAGLVKNGDGTYGSGQGVIIHRGLVRLREAGHRVSYNGRMTLPCTA